LPTGLVLVRETRKQGEVFSVVLEQFQVRGRFVNGTGGLGSQQGGMETERGADEDQSLGWPVAGSSQCGVHRFQQR